MANQKVWNSDFVNALDQLEMISKNRGNIWGSRAYKSASDAILTLQENVYDINQLKNTPKIGKSILEKLNNLVENGKIEEIEKEKRTLYINSIKYMGLVPKKH